jgi:addiction module RelB/DinJ family antitoxin
MMNGMTRFNFNTRRLAETEKTKDNFAMTGTFKCRVDKTLLKNADEVSEEMGTSTGELVRIFLKQLVKRRALPFTPKGESEEDEMLGPLSRRRAMSDLFHEG